MNRSGQSACRRAEAQAEAADGGGEFIHDAQSLDVDGLFKRAEQVFHSRERGPGKMLPTQPVVLDTLNLHPADEPVVSVEEVEYLSGLHLHS